MTATPYTAATLRSRLRQRRLAERGYYSYKAYLASPRWLRVRRDFSESDEPQDCICGAVEELQLHHLTYERVGAEELSDLTWLCAKCHTMIHVLERRGEMGLDFTGFVSDRRAARYAAEGAEQTAEREAWLAQRQDEKELIHEPRRLMAKLMKLQREASNKGIATNDVIVAAIRDIGERIVRSKGTRTAA